MTKFSTLKKKMLADPKVKAEYDALGPEYELARKLIEARMAAGLAQEQVARKMKTKQAAIARMESGRQKPSLSTPEKFAAAVERRAVVDLV